MDDPGHPLDLEARVHQVLQIVWKDRWEGIEREACEILGVKTLRDYFRKATGFFADHLKRCSKSRRKAPIYWPLSTTSGSYTVWLYYHRLTDQTLYSIANKYVETKIDDVQRTLKHVEDDLPHRSGTEATRLREQLHELRQFVNELQDMKQELLRIAALPYKPDLNDGVIINAAPLYKLFRHRTWAKDCEDCWEKLEKGDYDWAHTAYTIWPERAREKCQQDRSLAIAHGLEDLCKVPLPAEKKSRKRSKV